MKKSIIIFSTILVILSLLIIGFQNWNNTEASDENSYNRIELVLNDQNLNLTIPDLYYGVDERFAASIKEDVHNATSIYDFLNDEEKQQIAELNSVDIIIIKDNQQSELRAYGTEAQLTDAQIKLLRSTDYFSHFTIRTEFKEKNKDTGKLEARFFGPHLTVVPEKQATYVAGKEVLIEYLKSNSKDNMSVIKEDDLGAIKLSFIVTKDGLIKNVKHDAMTTGYPSIDEKFMELLKNIPGKWSPAENANGEKIDYELVFTFGPANGC